MAASLTAPPRTARHSAVAAVGVTKVYGSGDATVRALDEIDVAFEDGAFTAIMGPSGSGKSTLLHCLAGLDTPTSGKVLFAGTDIGQVGDRELTRLRRDRIGFVFQAYNLVPTLTAAENITLPLRLAGRNPDPAAFDRLVELLGVRDRLSHKPAQLSGGQQQRVAVARALLDTPDVVFADEPTGALDSRSGSELLGLLRRVVDEHGQTIVMVTHDPRAAAHADRVVFLADGRVVDELFDPSLETVASYTNALDRA